jgi:glycosyltransferase involved in cell wall biosynthesis
MAGHPGPQFGQPLRAAVVGISTSPTCGVHDHAVVLAQALERERVRCSVHWLRRSGRSLGAARSEVRAWTRTLASELQADPPDAVLMHYSVFAYSYRGIPLFVGPTLSALRRSQAPLVTVLHELAYPWRRGGWRGTSWALTQRAALVGVVRDCAAALLTADFRAEWLASRIWLPRRPLAVAPVFSNLPFPGALTVTDLEGRCVGLFGYSYEGAAVALVLDALRLLRDRGGDVRLALLGAPGRDSRAGEAWVAAARSREIEHALCFSGALAAQELSDALAACDVLLFADATGPSSRKGTLAASLASGKSVVAIDGPRQWSELIRSEAAIVVAPRADQLAESLGVVLADERLREELGARGRAFATRHMSVERTAEAVTGLLAETIGRTRQAATPSGWSGLCARDSEWAAK